MINHATEAKAHVFGKFPGGSFNKFKMCIHLHTITKIMTSIKRANNTIQQYAVMLSV